MDTHLDLPLTWPPEFSTGIDTLDDQHRVLISMLNKVHTDLTDHSPLHQFEEIVRGLQNYAGYHFDTEARYAAESGYLTEKAEEAAEHLAQHQAFSEQVASIKTRLLIGQRIPKRELLGFLAHWLIHHILNTDKQLGRFVCARNLVKRVARPSFGRGHPR